MSIITNETYIKQHAFELFYNFLTLNRICGAVPHTVNWNRTNLW
jgi:hypothetical protein